MKRSTENLSAAKPPIKVPDIATISNGVNIVFSESVNVIKSNIWNKFGVEPLLFFPGPHICAPIDFATQPNSIGVTEHRLDARKNDTIILIDNLFIITIFP